MDFTIGRNGAMEEFLCQACLAQPCRRRDNETPWLAGNRLLQRLLKAAQFGFPPDERYEPTFGARFKTRADRDALENAANGDRLGDALQSQTLELTGFKKMHLGAERVRADQDFIGAREIGEPRGDVDSAPGQSEPTGNGVPF